MQSIRRTARLTTSAAEPAKLLIAPVATKPAKSAPRGYVAINMSLDSRTDMIECIARKDMTITGEHGASVNLKAGEKFSCVRAASLGENMWYIVRHVSGMKKCSCPANKPCRHEIRVAAQTKKAEQVKAVEEPASYVMSEAKLAALSGASVEAKPEVKKELKKSSNLVIFSEVAPAPEASKRKLSENVGMTVAKARSILDAPLNGNKGFSMFR